MDIVFSDLDGTFLTPNKEVHPHNLRALEAMEEAGVPFVICTGRPLSGIPEELRRLPSARYAVCVNGATVVDLDRAARGEDPTIHATPMGPERAAAFYRAVAPLDIEIDVMADGRAYAERERFERLGTYGLAPGFLDQIRRSRTVVDGSLLDLLPSLGRVDRMSVYFHTPEERDTCIAAVEADPTLSHTSSESCNLEISDAAASKGAALAWLCDHLGVPVAGSVAFGDGMNDTSMLEAAGTGVAMANAQPGVAEFADDATRLTNVDGGVGDYILRAL